MKKQITLNGNDLRRLVTYTVKKVLKEAYYPKTKYQGSYGQNGLAYYGLTPTQLEVAKDIVNNNKRAVDNCQIRYANELAWEWMRTSDDEEEKHFIKRCMDEGLEIYEFLDGWQTVGLIAF